MTSTTFKQVVRVILFILFWIGILVLVAILWPQPVGAEEKPEQEESLKQAILWLATVQYQMEQEALGVKWGPHPILKNEEAVENIASGTAVSASRWKVDPYLILVVAWRESHFEQKVYDLQKKGFVKEELGYMQVHGSAAFGCDLTTAEGQISCGTKWLKKCLELCEGSEKGALAFYASGYTCRPKKNTKFDKSMDNRVKLWQKLRSMADTAEGWEYETGRDRSKPESGVDNQPPAK